MLSRSAATLVCTLGPTSALSLWPMHSPRSPQALYASKICSYAQGMNIIKAKSDEKKWGVNMGGLARIWKVGASAAGRALESCSKA